MINIGLIYLPYKELLHVNKQKTNRIEIWAKTTPTQILKRNLIARQHKCIYYHSQLRKYKLNNKDIIFLVSNWQTLTD